jgi:hypothetical protein
MQRSFYAVIIAAIAFMWMAQKMVTSIRRIESGASGEKLLDLRVFGYSAAEAHRFMGVIGDEGRSRYRWQLRFEWLFILAYACLCGAVGIALSAFIYNQGWILLAWVPSLGALMFVAAALADLDESQHIARVLKIWPRRDEAAAVRADKATRLKWMFTFAGVALIVAGCALAAIARLKSG